MNKVAVFDLDGTLLDSLADIALCANTALEISGLPRHSEEAYKGFVGWGVGRLVQNMMTPGDYLVHGQRVRADYEMLYSDLCARGGHPYDGVPEMLRRLQAAGWRTAVVSNKPHAMTQAVWISTYGGALDMAVGQRDGAPPKPDPAGVLEVLREFDARPGDCVYAGDSDVDVQTGKAACLYTVAVTWGFQPKDVLKAQNPDALADSLEELEKIILARG